MAYDGQPVWAASAWGDVWADGTWSTVTVPSIPSEVRVVIAGTVGATPVRVLIAHATQTRVVISQAAQTVVVVQDESATPVQVVI